MKRQVAVVGAVDLWRWGALCTRHGAVSRILRTPLKPAEARLHATILDCTPEKIQSRPRAEVCQIITLCDVIQHSLEHLVSSHP